MHYKILAIDPGTKYCGISLLYCDEQWQLTHIESYTIDVQKCDMGPWEDLLENHGEKMMRIYAIAAEFAMFLYRDRPDVICCESPFYNRLRPTAFAPLVEMVFALRNTSVQHDPLVPFLMFEPLVVKKAITGKAHADKLAVKKAVSENPEILKTLVTPLETLSEHAIDSIAVGWAYISTQRKG